jgi:hypothetical protein
LNESSGNAYVWGSTPNDDQSFANEPSIKYYCNILHGSEAISPPASVNLDTIIEASCNGKLVAEASATEFITGDLGSN